MVKKKCLSLWLISKSILKRSRRSWRNLQWSAALRRNAIGGMQWFEMQCRDVTLRCSQLLEKMLEVKRQKTAVVPTQLLASVFS